MCILTLMIIFIFIWKVTYICLYIHIDSTCEPCTASCPSAILVRYKIGAGFAGVYVCICTACAAPSIHWYVFMPAMSWVSMVAFLQVPSGHVQFLALDQCGPLPRGAMWP